MKLTRYLSKCLLAAFIVASTNAHSTQLLTKLPGIDGEYDGIGFENQIEILTLAGEIAEGGCDSFVVEKALDITSAAILSSTKLATRFDDPILISSREPGGDGTPFTSSRFSLYDAAIAKVTRAANNGPDIPTETLTIAAESLTLEVYKQKADGTVSLVGSTTVVCGKVKNQIALRPLPHAVSAVISELFRYD